MWLTLLKISKPFTGGINQQNMIEFTSFSIENYQFTPYIYKIIANIYN